MRPIQSDTGGFGGGHGQIPHLATTYASVLALVLVGGNAIDLVDRNAMYVLRYIVTLKELIVNYLGGTGWES